MKRYLQNRGRELDRIVVLLFSLMLLKIISYMFGSNQVMINYSQEEKFGILLEVDNFPINRHLTRLNTLQYYDARSPKEP